MKLLSILFVIFLLNSCKLMGQQNNVKEKNYISPDHSVIIYPDSSSPNYSFYINKIIGIKFEYTNDNFDPVSNLAEAAGDSIKWETYVSPGIHLKFIYPLQLEVNHKVENNGKNGNNYTILLGYNYMKNIVVKRNIKDSLTNQEKIVTKDSTQPEFASLVKVYLTKKNFEEAAEDEYFGISPTEEKVKYTKGKDLDIANTKWITYGLNGHEVEASFLNGKVWKGLRAETFTGVSHSNGEYIYAVPSTSTFLFREWSDSLNIVTTYYEGPIGSAEDDNRYIINENEFYKIVESIKRTN